MRFLQFLLVAAATTLLGGCGTGSGSDSGGSAAEAKTGRLSNIGNVLELRSAFNDDRGVSRLILLLSPT
jgi:hypothetical protein